MDDATKVALILRRLHFWVMGVVFFVFHLGIVVLVLVCLWLWQITPSVLIAKASLVFRRLNLSTLLEIAGALGLSILGALYFYLKFWKWVWKIFWNGE